MKFEIWINKPDQDISFKETNNVVKLKKGPKHKS